MRGGFNAGLSFNMAGGMADATPTAQRGDLGGETVARYISKFPGYPVQGATPRAFVLAHQAREGC